MVAAKSEQAQISNGLRFFLFPELKGLKKMIKTLQHNKNTMPYNGTYKRIQAHRQAQNKYRYTCINIGNKPLDGLIFAIIGQNKQSIYTQVFPQVIHQKSPKFNSSGIKQDREIHTDSYIAILN